MNDFSKLTAAITALKSAVDVLAAGANVQPQIDTATAQVQAITDSITPAPPPPAG